MEHKVAGTVEAGHIDKPEKEFLAHVLRGKTFNEHVRPERWELWKVKASSRAGAVSVANHHFYRAKEIIVIGETNASY